MVNRGKHDNKKCRGSEIMRKPMKPFDKRHDAVVSSLTAHRTLILLHGYQERPVNTGFFTSTVSPRRFEYDVPQKTHRMSSCHTGPLECCLQY